MAYTHDHHFADRIEPTPALNRRAFIVAGGRSLGAALIAAAFAACRADSLPIGPSAAPAATGDLATPSSPSGPASALEGFERFAPTVRAMLSGDWWLVESSGMPAHNMMVGIKSWQQQVPLPQPYTGTNAWRIPARPVLASAPVSARHALYRGAIALAVNGVPIFNALNNRGDDAYLAGELDNWGGHSGRGDDYHYHIAPLHLQEAVGKGLPIGYALDGFKLYGMEERDGSPATALDEFNGHTDAQDTYHYHSTLTYPYINGGLRGVVRVRDDQIDPQPSAAPMRPPLQPLRGATITGFDTLNEHSFSLRYAIEGRSYTLNYGFEGNAYTFEFIDPAGTKRVETYRRR